MGEKNFLSRIPAQQMPERQSNFLSRMADEVIGAFERYGRRSGAQRDASLALLNQAVDPNTDPLTGAWMKALGLAGLITHPLAFFPTGDEWRERLANAGNTSRLGQSVGGMLGDLPSIVDPHLLAGGGGALAMAPLVGKMAGKVDNVADAGRVSGMTDWKDNLFTDGNIAAGGAMMAMSPLLKGADDVTGQALKKWATPQTRDLGVNFRDAVDAYNSEVPSMKFQFDELGGDAKASTYIANINNFDDEVADRLRPLADEKGNIGIVSGGPYGDSEQFFHPSKMPSQEDLMLEALGSDYAKPAKDISDVHSNIGTRWGENPNAVSLINIAKQLGYDVDNISRSNWNRYNEASRDLTDEERSLLASNGLNPDDYRVSLKLRASDHTRTSSQHAEPDINLSPEGDDFYDAAMKLADATVDKDGNLIFRRRPLGPRVP